jgi:hypothetical protein
MPVEAGGGARGSGWRRRGRAREPGSRGLGGSWRGRTHGHVGLAPSALSTAHGKGPAAATAAATAAEGLLVDRGTEGPLA